MMECGAGWGPWIGAGYGAARQLGIETIRVIGVEGHEQKVVAMAQHFEDNGASPEEVCAIHGLVAAESGIALFPVAADSSMHWRARKLGRVGTDHAKLLAEVRAVPFEGRPGVYSVGKRNLPYNLVPSYSLLELMGDHELIDYIHFDIQGSEREVIETTIEAMNARVRVIFVGTHSGEIEAALRVLLPANDWHCAYDTPQWPKPVGVPGDGSQVWLNRRFF